MKTAEHQHVSLRAENEALRYEIDKLNKKIKELTETITRLQQKNKRDREAHDEYIQELEAHRTSYMREKWKSACRE